MIKGYTKQTIIICFLLQGIALSSRAQEQQMWQRYHDKCRREASIIDTLPSKLEKALHWSPRQQQLSRGCSLFFHQPI